MSTVEIADLRTEMKTEVPSSLNVAVSELPQSPVGWSFFCKEKELARGPVGGIYLGRRLVALKDDAALLNGVCGGQLNLIEADRELAGYFHWLSKSARGIPASGSST